MNTRNDPDSEANADMIRDNERAVFAAKMQAKQAMTTPSPEAVAAAKTHPKYDDAYPVWKRELEEMAQRAIDTATADLRAQLAEAREVLTYCMDQSDLSNQLSGIEMESYFAWINERAKLALSNTKGSEA